MEKEEQDICIYRSGDLGGFCAGAIFSRKRKEEQNNFEMYPLDYEEEISWKKLKNAIVYVLDFSIQPWEDFQKLARIAKRVIWIDHHISAIKNYEKYDISEGNFLAIYDTKQASCELAWEYFYPDVRMPKAVRLLGRYDVWDHTDEDTLPFQYGVRRFDIDPANGKDAFLWNYLLADDSISEPLVDACIRDGRKYLTI